MRVCGHELPRGVSPFSPAASRLAFSSIALVAVILAALLLDVHVRRLDRGLRQNLGGDAHPQSAQQSRLEPSPGEPLLLDGPQVPALMRHTDEERHERVQGDAAWPEAYHHHRDRARRNEAPRAPKSEAPSRGALDAFPKFDTENLILHFFHTVYIHTY